MTNPVGEWRRRREVLILGDVLLSVLVFALCLTGLRETDDCPCPPVPGWGYALIAVQALVLVFRRRWPATVAVVSGTLAVAYGVSSLPDPPLPYPALVAIYTAAARATQRRAILVAAVAAVQIAIAMALDRVNSDYRDAVFNYLVASTAWLLGFLKSAYAERMAAADARAAQVERTRVAEARRAVMEERNRISRELHDIVAHHVSMMVVQAEAAPLLVETDPASASAAMGSISQTGRAALAEMRRMMALLRDDDATPLAPQPELSDVTDLVDGIRATGVDISLDISGHLRRLPPGTELAAYRVLQEALTNVLKHARGSGTQVRIDYGRELLGIEVTNDHAAAPRPTADLPGGHGLVLMRERIKLLGGDLTAGPDARGAWAVRAQLPIGGPER